MKVFIKNKNDVVLSATIEELDIIRFALSELGFTEHIDKDGIHPERTSETRSYCTRLGFDVNAINTNDMIINLSFILYEKR